jgi:hypothetical protein
MLHGVDIGINKNRAYAQEFDMSNLPEDVRSILVSRKPKPQASSTTTPPTSPPEEDPVPKESSEPERPKLQVRKRKISHQDTDDQVRRNKFGRMMCSLIYVMFWSSVTFILFYFPLGWTLEFLLPIFQIPILVLIAFTGGILAYLPVLPHFIVMNDGTTMSIATNVLVPLFSMFKKHEDPNSDGFYARLYQVFGPAWHFKYPWEKIHNSAGRKQVFSLLRRNIGSDVGGKDGRDTVTTLDSSVKVKWQGTFMPSVINGINFMRTTAEAIENEYRESVRTCIGAIFSLLASKDLEPNQGTLGKMVSWCFGIPVNPNLDPDQELDSIIDEGGEFNFISKNEYEKKHVSIEETRSRLRENMYELRNDFVSVQEEFGVIFNDLKISALDFPSSESEARSNTLRAVQMAKQQAALVGIDPDSPTWREDYRNLSAKERERARGAALNMNNVPGYTRIDAGDLGIVGTLLAKFLEGYSGKPTQGNQSPKGKGKKRKDKP